MASGFFDIGPAPVVAAGRSYSPASPITGNTGAARKVPTPAADRISSGPLAR